MTRWALSEIPERFLPSVKRQVAKPPLRLVSTVTPQERVFHGKHSGRLPGAKDLKPRRRLGRKAPSNPVGRLLWQIEALGLPIPVREKRFHPTRKWRFDLAWEAGTPRVPGEVGIAMEIDGVTPEGGRHQRIAGYNEDARKINEATLMGWLVFRVTPAMVKSGEAVRILERVFENG